MTRLIMQILRVPEEIARIILGYIPVRRRLTVSALSYGSRLPFLPDDLAADFGRVERTTLPRWERELPPPINLTWLQGIMRDYFRHESEGGKGTWGYLQ